MQKKYIVRLSESEHQHLEEVVKTLSSSSQKVRRAQILLKADIERANWRAPLFIRFWKSRVSCETVIHPRF